MDVLPKNVLSPNRVEDERKKERDIRDIIDDHVDPEIDSEKPVKQHPANDIYQILKNNEIMGQILRNKYGSLEKTKIEEIIETVADGGLRIVKLSIVDEEWVTRKAYQLHKAHPDYDVETIEKIIQFLSFVHTIGNIEKIVSAINVPEIKEVVSEVVRRKSTPAYDLIGYFNHLEGIKKLTDGITRELEMLLKKHNDFFLQSVLSMRTQYYMNTHHSDAPVEQAICSVLKIKYSHKALRSKGDI